MFESNVPIIQAGHVNSGQTHACEFDTADTESRSHLARIIGQAVLCLGAVRNGCSPKKEDFCHMALARMRMANPLCSMWIGQLQGPNHAKPGPTFASLSQTYCCQARC